MASKVDPHLDTEILEKYSSNSLSERAVARLEEHLLICQHCRTRLEVSDTYTAAMGLASKEIRYKQRHPALKVAVSNPLK